MQVAADDVKVLSATFLNRRRLQAGGAGNVGDIILYVAITIPSDVSHSVAELKNRFNELREAGNSHSLHAVFLRTLRDQCSVNDTGAHTTRAHMYHAFWVNLFTSASHAC